MVDKPNSVKGVVCGPLVDGCCVNKIQAILAGLFVSKIEYSRIH
jgi:hypothetical protein